MKSLITIILLGFCLTNLKAQITIDSIDIIKHPITPCYWGYYCDRGEIKIHLSNVTPNYTWNVRSTSGFLNLNGTSSLDTLLVPICKDTIIVEVQDSLNITFDVDTLFYADVACQLDTVGWIHPRIKIDSLVLINMDSLNPSRGRLKVYPSGGHNPNYVYYLDTIFRDSIPNPPLFIGQGLANYRGWQDTVVFDSLPWRWYGVSCIDTSRLEPKLKVRTGYTCENGCGDTLPIWAFVPKIFSCGGGPVGDCDPFTGTYASYNIDGGLPPFTSTVTNITTNTVVYTQKSYDYTGNYQIPNIYMDSCHEYSFSIIDSLGNECLSYTEDIKETIFTPIDTTQSRIGTCCDGTFTFSMQTQTCGGSKDYVVTSLFGDTITTGPIFNNHTVTLFGLCGNQTYIISDTNGCSISQYIVMNDRECDSSASVNEINNLIEDIKLYPNPASSILNIELNSLKALNDNINITIYDALGKVILVNTLKAEGKTKVNSSINIDKLNKGIYNVVIQISEDINRQTLIKQ